MIDVVSAAAKGVRNMSSDLSLGLYFLLGLLLAFYFLAPFLELALG